MTLDLFSNKIGVEPRHLYIYQGPMFKGDFYLDHYLGTTD